MPQVRLHFEMRGWCSCTVDVPQDVVDQYNRETEKDDPDDEALDRLLAPYVDYDGVLEQLDDPEDIELTWKEAERGSAA